MEPMQFLLSAMAYGHLLHRLGVQNIQIFHIPLQDLQLMPQ